MRFFLDSNLLRYVARRESGHENILANIDRVGIDNCLLSTIAVFELQASALNHNLSMAERADISRYIGFYQVLTFGKRAASAAGRVKAELQRAGKHPGDVVM